MSRSAALLDDAVGHVAAAVPQGDRVAVQAHLDGLGIANQRLAAAADQVVLMVSGLETRLK